jgi:TonB family protein
MSIGLIWSNFVAYSLQIGLLVGVAAVAPSALRLRSPGAKLAYWHLLLIACLLLPLVRPWRQQVISETVTVTSRVIAVAPPEAPAARTYSPTELALAVLAMGVAARLGWLAIGFWKLGRYRRRSEPFHSASPWAAGAELRIAPDISGPVTFGLLNPVVLLPPQFPDLDPRAQQAILCHELLHVERHDWLFTVGEEVVRAFFWFHPAIWWLLGEIQLAREQAVDREVIERTQAKDEYVDALLAIAGAKPQLDLAPAPLFLRKRHLKQRVVSILKESRMSKSRLLSALAASVCVLVATVWLVTNTFPLAAAPQVVNDSAGVTVDVGAATLMHRAPVAYPESARARRIQGAVVLELTFDGSGNVSDARVLSGPEELRKAALQSALQWHFAREAAGNKRQVTITFQPPAEQAEQGPVRGGTTTLSVAPRAGGEPQGLSRALDADEARKAYDAARKSYEAAANRTRRIRSIDAVGLPEDARRELLSKLSGRIGTPLTSESMLAMANIVRDFDEHLTMPIAQVSPDEVAVTITAPTSSAAPRATLDAGGAIRVGGNIQAAKLVRQPRPVYPAEAKDIRLSGVVKLMAIIAKDGTIKSLEVMSGHPMLVPPSLEAVRQWVYQPTLFNGEPVEVQTQIDVNFTLSQ